MHAREASLVATMTPLFAMVLLGSCARSAIAVRLPPSVAAHVDMSRFQRVWIAGFVTSANTEVNLNDETVRVLQGQLLSKTSLRVVEADPITLEDEHAFAEAACWKKLAEEYEFPLIVTGSIRLTPAPPNVAERRAGRRTLYFLQKGFVLESTFVFIDGVTGGIVFSERLPRRIRYGTGRRSSTLSLYFELMDHIMPDFLRAISGQQGESVRHVLR